MFRLILSGCASLRGVPQFKLVPAAALIGALASLVVPAAAEAQNACNRTLTADIVAFDMPLMYNRLGAQNINGMMFALKRDVINLTSGKPLTAGGAAEPGNVALRPDKRPRPLVLRVGAGDCLAYTVTNLLAPARNPFDPVEERSGIPFNLNINDQVTDRRVSLRFQGTELVTGIADDGSFVGNNGSSLVAPGGSATYTVRAPQQGTFVGTSYGATAGGEGLGGNTANGLWAVLTVGPRSSAFYRSQLTREEMDLASGAAVTAAGQPVVDYEARYPMGEPWESEGKAGLPIINMVDGGEIVHSEINAIVGYGPYFTLTDGSWGLGHFPSDTFPLESVGKRNPTVPNRLEPYRDFTIAFHDEVTTKQAFPLWFEDPVLGHTLHGVRDSFMINYGSGGIGSEIIANRLRIGPMHDCINCAYEEFFLTAFTVGDVGMLVDVPANVGLEGCTPGLVGCAANGPKANFALYPDDPSNVHHTYVGDATVFNNLHIGPGEAHVFHLHNHQWLFNPNDDNSNYLDAQGLGPGSGYSYHINFGGAGNRNKTVGDAIFHCHFYPHFAQGMWEMWRIHDVFEHGTELVAQAATVDEDYDGAPDRRQSFVENGLGIGDGTPAAGARALPDGEIIAGTPIPAVVPLPGKAMPPMPAPVTVKANTNTVCLDPLAGLVAKVGGACPAGTDERATGSLADVTRIPDAEFGLQNPGYPFWIAGIEHTVGQRPPTPPLDMLTSAQASTLKASGNPLWQHPGFADPSAIQGWDGGLPRFTLDGYSTGGEGVVAISRLDMSKEILKAKPFFFPEQGTELEQAAMAYHAKRNHTSYLSDGYGTASGDFVLNGAKPVAGAPYNEPCIDDQGDLLDGAVGDFFGGQMLTSLLDPAGMTTKGSSPFNAVTPRVYKAANVQLDAVFNKLGYHYPQQRIIALWQDVVPTVLKQRPPEPFVIRMNTFDCTQYVHSNVVPKAYELDDYQVRTPTDIIGQHIHLPKWDLTSADGSANGWNYEDGTLSPGMVVEVIEAINHWGDEYGHVTTDVEGNLVRNSKGDAITDDPANHLHPLDHPFFGATQFAADWVGARSTLQRWFADPVVNVQGVDRGLGIIFTHDHYGPSTHQQIGLYATVLVEPAGSKWVHNETGTQLHTRTGPSPAADGGPTSWQAAILTGSDGVSGYNQNVGAELVESHREFYFEYSDFQHAYQPGVYVGAGDLGFPLGVYTFAEGPEIAPGLFLNAAQIVAADPNTFRDAIQPSFRQQASLVNGFPVDIWEFPPFCPGDDPATPAIEVPRPCPEAISADDPGMYVVNYRNESIAARIFDPNRLGPDGRPGTQADGRAGDLAFALDSNVKRVIADLNDKLGQAPGDYGGGACSGVFCPPITDLAALSGGDPFTPTMRAYDGDRVHIKVQAGAHEEEHTKSVQGVKWLQAGSGFGEAKNSGWRNAQPGGISEQFSFRSPVFADINQRGNRADYAYTMNASFDGWVTGTWGLLRSYSNNQNNLFALPNNDATKGFNVVNRNQFNKVCPKAAPVRGYDITAVLAEDVLPVPAGVTVQDLFPGAHEGRAPNGGTLVYNTRPDSVAWTDEARGGMGPLHDPTAILYVHTDELVAHDAFLDYYVKKGKKQWYWNSNDPACINGSSGVQHLLPACPVRLRPAEPLYCPDGSQSPGLGFCDVAWTEGDVGNGVHDGAMPVEPIVVRANAGDCVDVTLRNKVLAQAKDANGHPVCYDNSVAAFDYRSDYAPFYADTDGDKVCESPAAHPIAWDSMPDLATGNAIIAMVRRDPGAAGAGMTSFQSNLMVPSAYVGLHPALVEYDVTRSDGTQVGQNASMQVAAPGTQASYQWYAGVIEQVRQAGGNQNQRQIELIATPVEFGGFNLMPADKLEQPQKGLLGAGVVYPQGSSWAVDAGTRTVASVSGPGGSFRDFTTVAQKGASMFYNDSYPIENLLGEGSFGVAEDAQDMGQMAINYGTEPLWFRFGLNPTDDAGFMLIPNAGDAYSNGLVGGDPQTPVFTAAAGEAFRQHVLMPAGPGRGSTYDLHGHVWQRDPYVCPGSADLGLVGKCDMGNGHAGITGTGEVGSRALGDNPIGFGLGGIESWFPGEHYEIVIPSAGGGGAVPGDYLFRDHMGLGNMQGLWGIVRVE